MIEMIDRETDREIERIGRCIPTYVGMDGVLVRWLNSQNE